ncbi:protealysin inhibitor emfourin [Lysobacter korlensis]|uniref:Protealysin inhibitor emfourin n=1 Tax=Lysobacter korlensis TaxID=553636 RepID=A0ABV6RXD1_9GAMM
MELTISVVRSGGIAGMRTAWDVHLDDSADDAESWRSLIEDCPWDAAPDVAKPDRFVYRITVNDRTVTVPESAIGPWRALTDRVRDAAERAGGPAR